MQSTELSPAYHRARRWGSPAALALELSDGAWTLAPHLDFISRTVRDRIVAGGARLILTIPPRHGKSELCSVWLPLWLLAMRPMSRVGIVTYGHQFSAKWGRKIRNLIRTKGPVINTILDPDKDAANEFETTRGGSVLCTGIGGVLIGHGFDLILFDDPYKSRAEVESEVIRASTQEFWTSTARNRLEPGGSVIVIMQRWREDDLVGFLQSDESGEEWETINLPAEAEEGDPLGRKVGDPLWPTRYDAEELGTIKRAIGSYNWASQYQQRPAPSGGGFFHKKHFRYFHERGGAYILERPDAEPVEVIQADCRIMQFIDTAMTDKTYSDFTACLTLATTPDGEGLVLDVARAKLEVPDQVPWIRKQRAKWNPVIQGMEDKGSGIGLIQAARREGWPLKILVADVNKGLRASSAVILYENGMIYHRAGAEWLADFEGELMTFPTGAHDDQVDVLAYAAREIGMPAMKMLFL